MALIWHSPRESTCLSGSENICQAKIRRIGPELRVLYNVREITTRYPVHSSFSNPSLKPTLIFLMKNRRI